MNSNDLQALRKRINGHAEDLNALDQFFLTFLKKTTQQFHKTFMTLNNHHLAIKMLPKPFVAFIKD